MSVITDRTTAPRWRLSCASWGKVQKPQAGVCGMHCVWGMTPMINGRAVSMSMNGSVRSLGSGFLVPSQSARIANRAIRHAHQAKRQSSVALRRGRAARHRRLHQRQRRETLQQAVPLRTQHPGCKLFLCGWLGHSVKLPDRSFCESVYYHAPRTMRDPSWFVVPPLGGSGFQMKTA